MQPRRIVAGYLFIQALAIFAWWLLLLTIPDSIAWFQPADWPRESLLAFGLADGTLLAGGSALVAFGVGRSRSWAKHGIWSLAAVAWYPTLYCLAVSLGSGQAWIAAAMMVALAGLTTCMATIFGWVEQTPATIRVTEMMPRAAVGWTLLQTALFWGIFLGVIPLGMMELQDQLGWRRFAHSGQTFFAAALFAFASLVGLSSGLTMAIAGRGTPLPTATAPRLVIAGPYRYVRNPMALAGILQGVAIGWFGGSWLVVGYALSGAVVWHLCVRPVEEADLAARFGDPYRQYQHQVGLWLPNGRPKMATSPSESASTE